MLIGVPSDPHGSESDSPKSDCVSEVLEGFQGVRSRPLHWTLLLLPWLVLFLLIAVGLVLLKLRDPMFTSGVVAAALSLFAFQILMQRIPVTLGSIWNRELIAARHATDAGRPASEEAPSPDAPHLDSAALQERYQAFVTNTEAWLNHPGQWLVGIVFVLLVGTWTFLVGHQVEKMLGIVRRLFSGVGVDAQMASLPTLLFTRFVIGLEALTGLILGLMGWRMVVVGLQVWRLGKEFDLTPQLGHPNRCGGFEPLGYLCLWNALIVTVPAVYLGAWIILGPRTGYGEYVSLFSKLLLVPMAMAASSFFLPLWGIHQEMVGWRARIRRQLDQLSQRIDHLACEMLDRADELGSTEGEEMARKLELMRQIYEQNKHCPVWPFDTGILVRFVSSQAVPVLGLTGLGKKIVDAIAGLLGFLAQASQM